MAKLLSDAEVAEAVAQLPGWERAGDAIRRSVTAPTFPAAITLVDRVSEVAESRDHHPDMDIRWRTVTFSCSTHSDGGITALDIDLAREISRLADANA